MRSRDLQRLLDEVTVNAGPSTATTTTTTTTTPNEAESLQQRQQLTMTVSRLRSQCDEKERELAHVHKSGEGRLSELQEYRRKLEAQNTQLNKRLKGPQ